MDKRPKVLFLDDEQNVLKSLRRLFLYDDLDVLTSMDATEALQIVNNGDISVIVSDNLMPGINGIEFLERAKQVSPDSVRIMLTGLADVDAAIEAINKGEVYRFVTKPWNDIDLRNIVLDSIDRHKIVRSLRQADECSLLSLAQTIELKDPYTKGHCDRVAKYAAAMAKALGLDKAITENIKRGSWLHDCGKMGVPDAILNYPGPLTNEQMDIIKKHPHWGADVARLAHLPEAVINVILYHHERYDGKGYPFGLKEDAIPLEARIVGVADVYDALTSDRPYRSRLLGELAMENILSGKGTCSDPRIVDAFIRVFGGLDGYDPFGNSERSVCGRRNERTSFSSEVILPPRVPYLHGNVRIARA